MATNIYPTEAPVGQFGADPSNRIREYQWAQYMHDVKQSHLPSFLLYGGALSDPDDGLKVNVAAGIWIIGARRVETTTTTSVGSLTNGATNYIWLSLEFTGDLITGASFSANITGTPPTSPTSLCVLCGLALTAGGEVTRVETAVDRPSVNYITYTGRGESDRLVFLGAAPKFVIVYPPANNAAHVSGATASAVGIYLNTTSQPVTFPTLRSSRPDLDTYGFRVSGALDTNSSVYAAVVFF